MKLALMLEAFDPDAGGAERSAAQIATELAARDHEVTVLAGNAPDHADVGPWHLQAWRSTRKLRTGRDVRRFARWIERTVAADRFDATLSFTSLLPATLVQPRAGIYRTSHARAIATRSTLPGRLIKRCLLSLTPKQRVLRRLEARTMADVRVHAFVAISRYMAEQFRQHFHVPDERIRVIPNAVELPPLTEDERAHTRDRVRQQFNLADDLPTFLFVALDPRRKGIGPLMHASAALRDAGQPHAVLYVGPVHRSLQKPAVDLKLANHFHFVGETRHIVSFYAAADVCVLPTYYDPASKVILEGLLMGIPAITTRYNGAADFIHPATPDAPPAGRVLDEPDDIPALAAAMHALCDPAERARCAAATANLRDQLTMKRHVDQLEALMHSVI